MSVTTLEINRWMHHPNDPAIEGGVREYKEAGFRVLRPDDVRELPLHERFGLVQQCSRLLLNLYGYTPDGTPRYPVSVDDDEVLNASIENGETHVFALTKEGVLRSMAAIVVQNNSLGGNVNFAELGRAAKVPGSGISSLALLKSRIPWALENMPNTDFLVSSTRSGEQWDENVPSSAGIAGVWWGRMKDPNPVPFVTTWVGYPYLMEKPEAFNSLMVPLDTERWAHEANGRTTYVGTPENAEYLSDVFREATDEVVKPHFAVDYEAEVHSSRPFVEVRQGGGPSSGLYVATDRLEHTDRPLVDQAVADEHLRGTHSQELVIEADVAATPESSALVRKLQAEGWTLAGWVPSQLEFGAVCPILSRLNPGMASEAVRPHLEPRHFSEVPLTREHMLSVYHKLRENALGA